MHSECVEVLFQYMHRSSKTHSKPHTPHSPPWEGSPLPLVGLCGHTHTPDCTVSNFNIPVVWPWVEALRAQDTLREIKSFWIIRECLSRICLFKPGQILRNDEWWLCSVWVQHYRSWTERWGEGEQMDSGVWLLLLLDGWFLLRHLAVTLIFKLML